MKKIALAFLILITFAACRDKNKDQNPITPVIFQKYSTWIVNGTDTFKTNNVAGGVSCTQDHSSCFSGFGSLDSENWFGISFYTDYLPSNGSWPLGDPSLGPFDGNLAFIDFRYNDKGPYFPINPEFNNDTLFINSINGVIRYELKPTWFVKNDYPFDSIMVEGIFNFNEP